MADDMIKDHGSTVIAGVIGLFVAGVQWLLGREIKRRDGDITRLRADHDDHSVRLRAIEIDHVTRADIANVHQHLEAMRARAEERHLEILDRIK